MGWFTSLVLKLFWYLPCAHFFLFSTPFKLNLSKGFRLLSNGKLPILKIFGSLRKVKLQHIIFFGIFPNPKFGFGMLPNLQPSKGHFLGNQHFYLVFINQISDLQKVLEPGSEHFKNSMDGSSVAYRHVSGTERSILAYLRDPWGPLGTPRDPWGPLGSLGTRAHCNFLVDAAKVAFHVNIGSFMASWCLLWRAPVAYRPP